MPPKSAAKAKPAYVCAECGWTTGKWVGRCGECQAWGTVDLAGGGNTPGRTAPAPVSSPAVPIAQIQADAAKATKSGIGEFDRVLGGGVVPGAVMLLAGEPGVGKSTLLLEAAARWSAAGRRALYVSGEESAAQVRLRAERTGALHDELYLAAETDLGALLTHIDTVKPSLLIVDSVQTIASADIDGTAGGVSQVREVAASVIARAKAEGIATLLVGHVTKDGTVAGPRVLEHLVDVVLQFEGDRTSRLRLLRAVKNRFGPVDEIGCFDLVDSGLVEVPDPSGLFVGHHENPVCGTCVSVSMEGRRPLLVEVQALTTKSSTPSPRRTASGLESARVATILAVLATHAKATFGEKGFSEKDVYAATVGGAKLNEPAVDLAIALAITSADKESPLAPDLVVIGELGLAGEVRPVTQLAARLREAARIGFTRAIVPRDPEAVAAVGDSIRTFQAATLTDAIGAVKSAKRLG